MPGKIINPFRILLAQKATCRQHNGAPMDVQRAWPTLDSWTNNEVTRRDAPLTKTLCQYFDCQVGNLVVFEKA